MKTANEIRQEFLKFFEDKEHKVVASAPLVPDDPTLLFTNSGMVQFKDVFLGTGNRPYVRAADTQKCLRVSGKHNDLDEVGVDTYHHTFFEMLGNWSFGDYFKQEAIRWAWELIVEHWGIDPSRLYATVHEGDKKLGIGPDDEAANFWKTETNIDHKHILFCDSKDNFWMMGDTGPCGPCSEIHVDIRPQEEREKKPGLELVNQDHPQVIEVWNLVFIQYNAKDDGSLEPLDAKHVDTGMGLERMVAVLQKKTSNYDTDVFTPIMDRVRELRGHSVEEMNANQVPYRVLADHGRAMSFLLADGVVPGNEKHKYVLRMVMRRALRFGKALGIEKPFMAEIGQAVIDNMGEAFPELVQNKNTILKWAEQEEALFTKTLDRGLDYFEEVVRKLKHENSSVFPGKEAFYLHDTLGFPIEVTQDVAREHDLTIDVEGFEKAMDAQRERSRGEDGGKKSASADVDFGSDIAATEFVGTDQFEIITKVLAVIETDKSHVVAFDKTPFYAEGGGQVADKGQVLSVSGDELGRIFKATKSPRGVFQHHIKFDSGVPSVGDEVMLRLDVDLRRATQRNHTATHILHAALHKVVGDHAKQAGSLVSPDELRFDFTHFEGLTQEQIQQIEVFANNAILADHHVSISEETLESAKAQGAMALFAEDYQGKESVRMVSIASNDDVVSRELCGGTHVSRTGEIGSFKILSEESVSAGVRRVKVATGYHTLDWMHEKEAQLHEVADLLDASLSDLKPRLEALLNHQAELQKELQALKSQQVSSQVDDFVSQKEAFGEAETIVAQVDLSGDDLKQLADELEGKLNNGVVVLGSAVNGQVQLVCKVNKAMTKSVKAGDMIKALTPIVGGGGGGAPHFAQGGGSNPDKLGEALSQGKVLLAEALG